MKRILFWVSAPFMVLTLLAWRMALSDRPAPSSSTIKKLLAILLSLGMASVLVWSFLVKKFAIAGDRTSAGLLVEAIPEDRASDGFSPGDILLGWERTAGKSAVIEASGDLQSPFDIAHVLLSQAPRGGLRVSGIRAGRRLVSSPGSIPRAPITRPRLAGPDRALYEEGRRLLADGQQDLALSLWLDTARSWRQAGMNRRACWMFFTVAQHLAEQDRWRAARTTYLKAIAEARVDDDAHVVALIKLTVARGYAERLQLDRAAITYHEALAIRQAIDPDGLSVAEVQASLGRMALQARDLERAERLLHRALSMREKLAPKSYEVIKSLAALATLAQAKGDRQRFYELYRRAAAVHQDLAPEGRTLTEMLNLGRILLADEQTRPERLFDSDFRPISVTSAPTEPRALVP